MKLHARSIRISRARAIARGRSDGAAMFIVVMTLGLLAAMGVYGLTATSADIKSAGHMRQALQGQKAGEHGLMMTAETLNPKAVMTIVQEMAGDKRTSNCKTAAVYAGPVPAPPAAQCMRLTEARMRTLAAQVNSWGAVPGFAPDSFGAVTTTPEIQIEVSNPIDVPPPPGYSPPAGSVQGAAPSRFTQVTVTVFVDVRSTPTSPAESVVAGRGRMTVGPITGSAPAF